MCICAKYCVVRVRDADATAVLRYIINNLNGKILLIVVCFTSPSLTQLSHLSIKVMTIRFARSITRISFPSTSFSFIIIIISREFFTTVGTCIVLR